MYTWWSKETAHHTKPTTQMKITCIAVRAFASPPSSCCMNGGVGGFQCLFKASPIIQVHLFSSYKCTQFLTEQSAYVRVLCCSQLSCLKWSFSKYSGGMSCSSSLPLRCNRSKHLCTPKKKNTLNFLLIVTFIIIFLNHEWWKLQNFLLNDTVI